MSTIKFPNNRIDDAIEKGSQLPPLIQTEVPSSTVLSIDSADKLRGNEGNFTVDLKYRLVRPRYCNLDYVIIPKIQNVNNLNNQIIIYSSYGGGVTTNTFSLSNGIYNTTTLSNELTAEINNAFSLAGIIDTVTTTYDPISRSFTISSVVGYNWYFLNTCSFITRGINLCGFYGLPAGSIATQSVIQSGTASMLYTKQLYISSAALSQFAYSVAISSNPSRPNNIIGTVNMVDLYSADDFDVSVIFTNTYKTIVVNGPHLSLLNSQRSLNSELDFTITDEFGYTLDRSLELDYQINGAYVNNLRINLIFNIYF